MVQKGPYYKFIGDADESNYCSRIKHQKFISGHFFTYKQTVCLCTKVL